jgi:peptidoglycan/LPS O-acetylase OafA/YrhL
MNALRLSKRHFHALDASRLVAAVAVLFWHYLHFMIPVGGSRARPDFLAYEPLNGLFGAFYAYGHFAVEYFWIVSGFVFAHVYLGDVEARGRFWVARLARLWPLHLLTLGVVAALQASFWAQNGQHFVFGPNDAYHFALSLGLAHYWGFERGMSFNGPSWSLSVEVLAYAAFWALLPALRAGRTAIAAAAGASAALLALQYPELKAFACLAYFFAGVTIYFGLLRGGLRATPLALAGVAGLALAARFGSLDGFAFPSGGLWVASLFALALAADACDRGERLTLGKRWGDASYGTYLWHFPIQLALVMALDALPGGRALAQHWGVLALYLALALGAGFASHRWFEKPAQRAVLAAAKRLAERRPAYA